MEEIKLKYGKSLSILSWAEEERPREKLTALGKNSMALTDLLAIIIGSGNRELNAVDIARNILHKHPPNRLPTLEIADLIKFVGIGHAKAVTILAALELGQRCAAAEHPKRKALVCSEDVHVYLKNIFLNLDHEQFWILFLDSSSHVIAKEMISKGGRTSTIVDPLLVMKKAIGHSAKGIILAHNHPSGNLKPSGADRALTNKLKEVCSLLHVNVLDHLIFARTGFYSFSDEGILD